MTTSLVAGDISLRQKRKDAITPEEIRDYKKTGCPSCGACTFLGTASTMQCMAEALGLALPGSALMPATMRDILACARKAGRQIMKLVEKDIKVSDILTKEALENAIVVHSAIGGSSPMPLCTCLLLQENWEFIWNRSFSMKSTIGFLIWEILLQVESI